MAQDIVVSAVVRRCGTEELVAGLLLRTLQGLSGPASFSLPWDSTGFRAGEYYLEATLLDSQGNLLDSQSHLFTLGVLSGQMTSLSVTPEEFEPGQPVTIALAFGSTGTTNISGTAVIRVRYDGEVVQEFRHEINNLAPGSTARFDDVWETTGARRGIYTMFAYAQYAGMTSEALSTEVRTTPQEAPVYLPVIVRGHTMNLGAD